jgi:hypothetical protein|tara:strand:+ start:1552 stop:1734 length:183 start_codon:yes stop_codon:yes gene_type:complete
MNKWERRDGKLQRRSQSKFKQADDNYEFYIAKDSAKKASKVKKRWAKEIKAIQYIDDDVA